MRHLSDKVASCCGARAWWQFHGLKDEVLSFVIETGELAEHLRWHDAEALRARIA